VKELTGSKSEIALIPYDKAYEAGFEDMPRRVPDISRISGLVGYKPTLGLNDILTRVIEEQRSLLVAGIDDNQRSVSLKKRARASAERLLLANAKPVRKLLLRTGRDRAPRWPDIVQIESTNLCNAKCVFCPRDEMHRRQGVMDFDLFRKVVDECAALGITHVRVHNYGEPFLDKQLVEKVRYAKSKGIRKSA
jgi:hypothetical protein